MTSEDVLAGKVALITGGARGQGAAEGRLFTDEGATVVLADVLDSDGEQTA
jgi:3alpha(or 20beta)-hydroxysteroid dehydrogenase